MPARAAYAAALADVLPVDAHTTALAPSSAALEMATVMPRSLNEPVGLRPSYFSHTRAPSRSDKRGAGTSGVAPSSNVTTGVAALTGRKSRYSSIKPRQPTLATAVTLSARPLAAPRRLLRLLLADDAQQAADAV